MNDKKKAFADLIISGIVPTEAITAVFPGISPKTARNKSSLFGKDPEIMNYIQQNSGLIRDKINKIETDILIDHVEKSATKKAGSILTAIRKHQLLNEIAEGKIWNEKIVVVDGKIKRIKVKPNLNERLKAIEIANRMAGDLVKPKEPNIAKAEEVKKVIIMDDQSDNIKRIEE